MTLTEISQKLVNLAISIESYSKEYISEELFCLADSIDDLENDVVGTIAGLSKVLKEFERKETKIRINEDFFGLMREVI